MIVTRLGRRHHSGPGRDRETKAGLGSLVAISRNPGCSAISGWTVLSGPSHEQLWGCKIGISEPSCVSGKASEPSADAGSGGASPTRAPTHHVAPNHKRLFKRKDRPSSERNLIGIFEMHHITIRRYPCGLRFPAEWGGPGSRSRTTRDGLSIDSSCWQRHLLPAVMPSTVCPFSITSPFSKM